MVVAVMGVTPRSTVALVGMSDVVVNMITVTSKRNSNMNSINPIYYAKISYKLHHKVLNKIFKNIKYFF